MSLSIRRTDGPPSFDAFPTKVTRRADSSPQYCPDSEATIVSDDARSVLVPIFEEIVGYDARQIRTLFEEHGALIQEWDKVRTDWLTSCSSAA